MNLDKIEDLLNLALLHESLADHHTEIASKYRAKMQSVCPHEDVVTTFEGNYDGFALDGGYSIYVDTCRTCGATERRKEE